MDLVVHAQDVARPLGRPYRSPADVLVASLAYVAGNRFLGGPRRVAGLELVATDATWSSGGGAQVRGPVEDLLLVASGRPAGLAALHGPGVRTLTDRLRGGRQRRGRNSSSNSSGADAGFTGGSTM